MFKRIALLSFFFALTSVAMSQPDSGKFNNSVVVRDIDGFNLPASLSDISIFDGLFHFVVGNMLLSSQASGVHLSSPSVDTVSALIDPELTYAVRDPFSGAVYYTKNNSKGISQLYVHYEKKPGKFVTRRVKLSGLSSSVYHPVFTPDGKAMVFVSDSPLGFGGKDLWFSLRKDDEWLSPQNMGHHVNSGGDEIMPSFYGDFLIFSSDGRGDSYGGFDLYASRLVALSQSDTVMMYPIGRCPAFSLQAPFCTDDDDLAFVTSPDMQQGWWFRRNNDGGEMMRHFDGRLDCVEMHGVITSSLYDKVEGAYVVAARSPRPGAPLSYDTAWTKPDGSYTMYLCPGLNYEIFFHAENHFVTSQSLVPSRSVEERLYDNMVNDVQLATVALDSLISFPNLFSSSVSSELSTVGRANVDTLAQFMIENPGLRLNVYSSYNLSADIPFCSLLNSSRLRSLTEYLVSRGVNAKAISTYNSIPSSLKRSDNVFSDRNMSPKVQSSLTVGFSFMNY